MKYDFDQEERTRRESEPRQRGSGLFLYVIDGPEVSSHPLPPVGEVVIGRGAGADIVLGSSSVSRTHIRLRVGDQIEVEDLGSANGTIVRGERIEPGAAVALAPGDLIEIGRITVMVQRRFTAPARHSVYDHDYFEVRLQEACDRAARENTSFAVLRLRFGSGLVAPETIDSMTHALSPSAVVGSFGPNDYEVLLVDGADQYVESTVRSLALPFGPEDDLRWGVARFPADGRDAQTLLAIAGDQLIGSAKTGAQAVVVESPAMRELHRLVDRVAGSDISVLLLGETGVGKEVIAQRIHEASARRGKPLMRLCCASLTPSLMESELFGHVKGAFTGAATDHEGLLEAGDGGTVFLDEIGELGLPLQTKLLRVLEERKVRRVGGTQSRPIDVRFIAATNRDLEAEVDAGQFRRDLFYRLNGFAIVIPPLRERVEEILPLAREFVRQIGSHTGIAECAQEALREYRWPGNVRELRNAIERAVILAGDGPITSDHLPIEKMRRRRAPVTLDHLAPPPAPERVSVDDESLNLKEGVAAAERRLIMRALERADGNQTEAAKLLGISRQTLVTRLDAYDIPRPRKRS